MKVAVYGLWHLGCVTAACLAEGGHETIGLDTDPDLVAALGEGRAPLFEPGLDDLLRAGVAAGRLRFTSDPAAALREADVLWVAFDTPVDESDQADVEHVRRRLDAIAGALRAGTLVLVSSQVPVGFTRALSRDWAGRGLRFAVSPENLRLGKALEAFRRPERIVVGTEGEQDRARLATLFAPWAAPIVWMGLESAEMTKHAVNAFLATSVTFINELARLCERLGADAKEVERGLKSEGRIGPRAYLGPGGAFAGGTLARDLRYLSGFGRALAVKTPLVDGVLASNEAHKAWLKDRVAALLDGQPDAVVAVLGLTYKPGTSTLRRSSAVELCRWLSERGLSVRAHDPAVQSLPEELSGALTLCATAEDALKGADLAVLATEWPDYRQLSADALVSGMRRPVLVDPSWFLAGSVGADTRVRYFAPGRADTR